jgi:hypothetical protein
VRMPRPPRDSEMRGTKEVEASESTARVLADVKQMLGAEEWREEAATGVTLSKTRVMYKVYLYAEGVIMIHNRMMSPPPEHDHWFCDDLECY